MHWPFCAAKCPYCDFNSHVRKQVDQLAWAKAFEREIRRVGAQIPDRTLTSVFFGGGTPSLMAPETVSAVLDSARAYWRFSNDIEITLEANPTSVEAERFEGYARVGVNRVSLGIQALNDEDLRRLGRLHDTQEARAAYDLARSIFPRVSFDLIYARQAQSLSAWREELLRALDMAADHLSLYQLTVEQGTAFWNRMVAGNLRHLPDEDLAADLYELTQELCQEAGMPAYEVSNHAREGGESRHNLVYWRGGDYVGVGPGAHGRVTKQSVRYATESWKQPEAWKTASESGSAYSLETPLDPQDVAYERLIMGMRLSEGLAVEDVETVLDAESLRELEAQGLVWKDGSRIGATGRGRPLLNRLIAELVAA